MAGLAGYHVVSLAVHIVDNFTIDNYILMSYITTMMHDMIHVGCEELITEADEAQMEYERGEREREQREHWDALEAQYGPLHRHPFSSYEGMVWKD